MGGADEINIRYVLPQSFLNKQEDQLNEHLRTQV